MTAYYRAEIEITKQEDGLWRLFVPGVKGAWVDARTLEEGFSEIQEAIALMVKYYKERGWPLPETITVEEGSPTKAVMPILCEEYEFAAPTPRKGKSKRA